MPDWLCCDTASHVSGLFTPVNELNQAMREVQMGNLNAYVKETGRNEIADMMRYYNNMLRSIHVHVVENSNLSAERKSWS